MIGHFILGQIKKKCSLLRRIENFICIFPDTVDFNTEVPYNTENVPLSQLRRLHLCDDDQAFMNKVKSQGR